MTLNETKHCGKVVLNITFKHKVRFNRNHYNNTYYFKHGNGISKSPILFQTVKLHTTLTMVHWSSTILCLVAW